MTARPCGVPAAILALLLIASAAPDATARDLRLEPDPFSDMAPRHARPRHPARRALSPPPRIDIVTGYLPRNNNVPMYNEPPRRGPAW